MSIKILLVDDHTLLRQGVKSLVDKESGMEVVGEAKEGRQAVTLARELKPNVILMDVGMPGLNGVEATRQVLQQDPNVKVLALSMHGDKRYAAGMLAAGAAGYLLKDCVYDELLEAIRTVNSGKTYLSPAITGVIVGDYVERLASGDKSAYSVLTDREREVLQLVAEGKTTKDIGAVLHISVKTVETHRQNIMDKLDCHSIAELTRYAIREGITPAEG